MDSRFFLAFAVIGFVLLSGCTGNTGQVVNPPANNNDTGNNGGTAGNFDITITASGYEPSSLTVKKGSTVTWTNTTGTPNWPATAMHPTHERYPGSSITKCGSTLQAEIFDACKNLANRESYSFEFNEAGEWAYHDHVGVKMFGKIIVVE